MRVAKFYGKKVLTGLLINYWFNTFSLKHFNKSKDQIKLDQTRMKVLYHVTEHMQRNIP